MGPRRMPSGDSEDDLDAQFPLPPGNGRLRDDGVARWNYVVNNAANAIFIT